VRHAERLCIDMVRQLIRLLIGFITAVFCTAVFALDVVAEGEASIENDDLTLARKIALRHAMTSAIEQSGGTLQSSTRTTPIGVQERTSLTSRNQVLGSRIISEKITKGKLQLVAEIRLAGPGQPAMCAERPLRKALVTAFPLQLPEQLASGEFTGWPSATAEHLSRVFNASGRVLGASAAAKIPFVSANLSPEIDRKNGVPVVVDWAKGERAQFVLAGIFRDFGTTRRALIFPERQLIVEAFIFDGISGELIARQDFSRILLGTVRLPKTVVFGGKAFCESLLGQTYLNLMAELAHWAENTIGCLPFSARVMHVEGSRLHLDVGSDSGIEPGMELVLTRTEGKPITTAEGEVLAGERVPVAGVVVKSVQARYSVAEITAKKNPPVALVGDVLYGL
jgi:hypothetical protein